MTYKTKGVCASHIEFEVDDAHKIHNVRFIGGFKNTSCPDQLSIALEQVLNK